MPVVTNGATVGSLKRAVFTVSGAKGESMTKISSRVRSNPYMCYSEAGKHGPLAGVSGSVFSRSKASGNSSDLVFTNRSGQMLSVPGLLVYMG